jgi:hypothetical protein
MLCNVVQCCKSPKKFSVGILMEAEDGKFRDILLDALVNVICRHPVVVQPAEEIWVFFFAVNLPFGCGVVELCIGYFTDAIFLKRSDSR